MKRLFIFTLTVIALLSIILSAASADVYVSGYYRKDGTYVQPHYRSDPDGDPWNNWSTVGNVNPYTGEVGTKWPEGYSSYSSSLFSSGYSSLPASIPTTGEIFGRVLSFSGQAIAGTAVRIHNIFTPDTNTVIPANAIGEFRFVTVADGKYNIFYDAPGYIGQIQENIEVLRGIVSKPPTCILSPGIGISSTTGEIFGKVLNQAGQMIPGTCIRIDSSLMPTNPAGEFRFTLVFPGIYTIYYDAPSYKGQIQMVEVKAAQSNRPPMVIMNP